MKFLPVRFRTVKKHDWQPIQEVLFRHFTICTMSDTVIRVENLSKKYAIASQKQE